MEIGKIVIDMSRGIYTIFAPNGNVIQSEDVKESTPQLTEKELEKTIFLEISNHIKWKNNNPPKAYWIEF